MRDLQRALALSPEAEKGVISSKLQEAQEKQRLASRGGWWGGYWVGAGRLGS